MILEERISFYDEDDASKFIDYLKKEGCKTQKQTYSTGEMEERLVGKVDEIIRWLEKPETSRYFLLEEDLENAKEQIRDVKENINKITENHNKGDILFKKEELEESEEIFFRTYKEKYNSYLKQLSEGSEESTENTTITGDPEKPKDYKNISVKKEAEISSTKLRDAEPKENEISSGSKSTNNLFDDMAVPKFAYYNMLIEQGFAVESEEGFITAKETDGGDIRINLPLNNVELPEDFNEGEIVRQMHYEITKKYVVKIDPSVHMYCDEEELAERLYGLDIDEEEAVQFFCNLTVKKAIIYRLLEIISENNGISAEELTRIINEIAIRSKEDNSGYEITLDDNSVLMIVSELRKTGILSGNDKKIKLADKKKRKHR